MGHKLKRVKCKLVSIDLSRDKSVTFHATKKRKEQIIDTQAFWRLPPSLNSLKVLENLALKPFLNRNWSLVFGYLSGN